MIEGVLIAIANNYEKKKKGATKPKERKKFKKMKKGAPITITSTCENAQKESGVT
jgi:hypothetical protein